MMEVVFHDSAKGAMIIAQHFQPDDGAVAAMSDPGRGSADDIPRPSARHSMQFAGRPLGGSSRNVVGLSLYLNVGDVSVDLFGDRREAVLRTLFGGPEGDDAARELMAANRADRDRLLAAAARGEPVRIWYSDAPSELCGMLHAVDMLEALPCPIRVVKLPHVVSMPDGWKELHSWNDVLPGEFADFADNDRLLAEVERRALSAHWRQLARENAPLRAALNGGVHGVPEAFYDYLIDRHTPEGEFAEALLIGRILGAEPMGLSDGWFACRIDARIKAGELRVTRPPQDDHPYSRRLVRVKI